MKKEELNRLIKKYDLQYYDKENLLKRINYLIERYSQDMFSLDVSKVDELILIANDIESIDLYRRANWTIVGRTCAPYAYEIDPHGANVRFKMLNTRNFGNKDPIKNLSCIVRTNATNFQKFKDAEVMVIGDLIFFNNEVIVDVKSIKKAMDKKE